MSLFKVHGVCSFSWWRKALCIWDTMKLPSLHCCVTACLLLWVKVGASLLCWGCSAGSSWAEVLQQALPGGIGSL